MITRSSDYCAWAFLEGTEAFAKFVTGEADPPRAHSRTRPASFVEARRRVAQRHVMYWEVRRGSAAGVARVASANPHGATGVFPPRSRR